jgi:hypothetical protein
MTDEKPPILSIGAVTDYGPEINAWWAEIQRLALAVQEVRQELPEGPLNVNVVFHVEGGLVRPDFHGVRSGRLDKRTKHLMIQVAVEHDVSVDKRQKIVALFREAIGEAEKYARKKGIAEDLQYLWDIADKAIDA